MKGFELVRGIISDALVNPQGNTTVYFPIPVSDVATHVIARLKNAGYSIVKDSGQHTNNERIERKYVPPLMDTQDGFDAAAREVHEGKHDWIDERQSSCGIVPTEQFPDWPIDPSDYDED